MRLGVDLKLQCIEYVTRAGWLGIVLAATTSLAFAMRPTQQSELRWGGAILDTFSPDGTHIWTAEDGGRIRHSVFPGTLQQMQAVPVSVRDSLQRVFFLPDNQTGWAVGQNGWVIHTTDGGVQWQVQYRMPAYLTGGSPWEELWDIHFVDPSFGFLVGLHWMWWTVDGGTNWTPVTLLDENGAPFVDDELELYCVDAVVRPIDTGNPQASTLLGMAGAEPGVVFKTVDGQTWQVAFDARSLCPTSLPACAQVMCDAPLPGEDPALFEPWDIEISRHPTSKLALTVGGVATDCGLVFRSLDDGATWASESHECKCPGSPGCIDCSSDPLYNNDPSTQTDTWRLKKFSTLYGVAILDGDNTAIACGYSGQHVVRDPAYGVWRDRSSYSNDPFNAVGAATLPLFGAEANGGNATNGRAIISGMGGYFRVSANGGQTWANALPGEPWRIRDVHFFDLTRGWMAGQFFRLASTTDGGRSWTPAAPEPEFGTGFFNAVSFAGSLVGVAVGEVDNRLGPHEGKPKILITQDGGQSPWLEPTYYQIRPVTAATVLNEVAYAGGNEWWAAGDAGLMLHSQDHGQTWYQFGPPGVDYPKIKDINFHSVAFANTNLGLFVGERPAAVRGPRAVAFVYRLQGGNVQWIDVSPSDWSIAVLSDVDIVGNAAYIVGERNFRGLIEGVVFTSLTSVATGNFVQLTPVNSQPVFPTCDVGADLEHIPVLNEVEIAPDGDVWIAGECGRIWQHVPASTGWIEHKSDTDSHVRGMSFPAADIGFLGCHRASNTGQSIIRFRP